MGVISQSHLLSIHLGVKTFEKRFQSVLIAALTGTHVHFHIHSRMTCADGVVVCVCVCVYVCVCVCVRFDRSRVLNS